MKPIPVASQNVQMKIFQVALRQRTSEKISGPQHSSTHSRRQHVEERRPGKTSSEFQH